MPKKHNLDAKYLDWAEGVPQEILDKFLNSVAAEQIVNSDNYHSGMTKAQQRAAEVEAQSAREAARVAALDDWASKHSDLYQRLPEWADIIRSRKPEDVEQALSGAKREIEQQAADVVTAFQEGRLTEADALPIAVDLRKRYGALNEQVESFKQFRETEVPKLVGAWQENFANLRTHQANSMRAALEYQTELAEYMKAHPDRSPRKILDTFTERNAERQYKTFSDVAQDAYGEADIEQVVEQRASERLAAQQQQQPPATSQNEAPVTGSALGPFRRANAAPTPPPVTNAAGVRQNLMEFFHKQ